jgi:hypothetical protein
VLRYDVTAETPDAGLFQYVLQKENCFIYFICTFIFATDESLP